MRELPYMIGADPEISVVWDNKRLDAESVLDSVFGEDSLQDDAGELGLDGCSSTGEIRPAPSRDPGVVAGNIGKCAKKLLERLPKAIDLSTLSLWAPIGGHVHLELPQDKRGLTEETYKRYALKLSPFFLPILMGELKASSQIRLDGGTYGKICDARTGNNGATLELRSFSAEWITSEKLATSTLAYLGVIWSEFLENPASFGEGVTAKSVKQAETLQNMAFSDLEDFLVPFCRRIKKHLKGFKHYDAFKDEVDYILTPKKVLADKKKVNFCMGQGWGVKRGKKSDSKKTWLGKQDVSDFKVDNTFDIWENGDHKTGAFAELLRERSFSFAKGLTNAYYLFGFKKGLDLLAVTQDDAWLVAPEVESAPELERLKETMFRMRNKVLKPSGFKIDFKTNKILRSAKPLVVIGLPFAMREKMDTKAFLELIWDIEQGKIPTLDLATKIVPKGNPAKPAQELEEPSATRLDTDSSARRSARGTIERMEREGQIQDPRLEEQIHCLEDLLSKAPIVRDYDNGRYYALLGYEFTPGTGLSFLAMRTSPSSNGRNDNYVAALPPDLSGLTTFTPDRMRNWDFRVDTSYSYGRFRFDASIIFSTVSRAVPELCGIRQFTRDNQTGYLSLDSRERVTYPESSDQTTWRIWMQELEASLRREQTPPTVEPTEDPREATISLRDALRHAEMRIATDIPQGASFAPGEIISPNTPEIPTF